MELRYSLKGEYRPPPRLKVGSVNQDDAPPKHGRAESASLRGACHYVILSGISRLRRNSGFYVPPFKYSGTFPPFGSVRRAVAGATNER